MDIQFSSKEELEQMSFEELMKESDRIGKAILSEFNGKFHLTAYKKYNTVLSILNDYLFQKEEALLIKEIKKITKGLKNSIVLEVVLNCDVEETIVLFRKGEKYIMKLLHEFEINEEQKMILKNNIMNHPKVRLKLLFL